MLFNLNGNSEEICIANYFTLEIINILRKGNGYSVIKFIQQHPPELSLGFFCYSFCGFLWTGVGAFSSLLMILLAMASKASLM